MDVPHSMDIQQLGIFLDLIFIALLIISGERPCMLDHYACDGSDNVFEGRSRKSASLSYQATDINTAHLQSVGSRRLGQSV